MALETLVTDRGVLVDIGDGVLRRASIDGKTIGDVLLVDPVDPVGVSFQSATTSVLFDYVAYGSASGSVTTVSLFLGGGTMLQDEIGVPVAEKMTATGVATTFLADSQPSGTWTATLWRRPNGGSWSPAATFTMEVGP